VWTIAMQTDMSKNSKLFTGIRGYPALALDCCSITPAEFFFLHSVYGTVQMARRMIHAALTPEETLGGYEGVLYELGKLL